MGEPVERRVDWAIAGMVAVVAAALRLGARPDEGLFHDDAWVAASALLGSPDDLIGIGSNHPGFTGLLMTMRPVADSDPGLLVWPALVFAIAGPPALYLLLRRHGWAVSLALLPAAALLVAPTHLMMSARVKTGTIETVLVVGLIVAVGVIARRRWTVAGAVAWVAVMLALCTLSPLMLLAASVAGAAVVLHPRGDVRIRVIAVAVQAMLTLGLLLVIQRHYSVERLEGFWTNRHEAFIGFDPNPIVFVRDVIHHLGQVAEGFTALPTWLGIVVAVVVLVGLAIGATRTDAVEVRYAGLLVLAGIVLSAADKVPLGATREAGLRVSLWLVAPFALGAIEVLGRVRRRLAERRADRTVLFDGALVAAAVVIVVVGLGRAIDYPWNGTEPASEYVDARRDDDDIVFPMWAARFAYAVHGELAAGVVDEPESIRGLEPTSLDPRLRGMELPNDPSLDDETVTEVGELFADADRVFVIAGLDFIGGDPAQRAAAGLEAAGLAEVDRKSFGVATVVVWERPTGS